MWNSGNLLCWLERNSTRKSGITWADDKSETQPARQNTRYFIFNCTRCLWILRELQEFVGLPRGNFNSKFREFVGVTRAWLACQEGISIRNSGNLLWWQERNSTRISGIRWADDKSHAQPARQILDISYLTAHVASEWMLPLNFRGKFRNLLACQEGFSTRNSGNFVGVTRAKFHAKFRHKLGWRQERHSTCSSNIRYFIFNCTRCLYTCDFSREIQEFRGKFRLPLNFREKFRNLEGNSPKFKRRSEIRKYFIFNCTRWL